jgi:hypothetical protein
MMAGIGREMSVTMSMAPTLPESEVERDLRPRARTLSWLASLSIAAGDIHAAEGYLLELLTWCAFADREVIDVLDDGGSGVS